MANAREMKVKISEEKEKVAQLCPVCHGACEVLHSLYSSPQENNSTSAGEISYLVECRSCKGKGYVVL